MINTKPVPKLLIAFRNKESKQRLAQSKQNVRAALYRASCNFNFLAAL